MRRFASLLGLGTLCACAGGARAGRVPVAPAVVPERAPVPDAPRPVVGAPTAERMVTVPPLVGLDFEAAAAKARAAGLELMGVRVAGLPAGVVLDQNPAAGRSVPAGAPVRVGIASGAVDTAPPAASATASDLPPAPPPQLPPSVVPEAPALTVPLEPTPDAPAEGTSTEPLPVPSVLDRTEPVARRILTDAGFRVRIEATESGVKGRVMDQLPSPGDRVPRGSEVLLKVPGYVPITAESLGSPDSAPAIVEAPVAPPTPPTAPTPPPVPPTPPVEPPAAPAAPPPAEAPALPPAPPAPPVATLPPADVAPPADIPPPAPPATPIPSLDVPPEAPPPSVGTPPEPPPVVVAPPADEPPVPIFAGPGANPGATPAAPPAAPSAAPVAPPVPAPPAVSPDAPVVPAPVTPPAPPPIDDVPVPPSDAVPVPPDAAVPPSDSVPVPPSDAVPVPPPPPPSSPTEPGGQPAGPSLPGLEIPKPKSPPSDAQIPIAPSVSVEIAWEPVAGATGYLIELEELVDAAWSPLQRRIVKTSKVLVQVEPSNPTAADVRWRVRSVVGRRGGRPAPWVVFHLR